VCIVLGHLQHAALQQATALHGNAHHMLKLSTIEVGPIGTPNEIDLARLSGPWFPDRIPVG
jgi:hypothetical protein